MTNVRSFDRELFPEKTEAILQGAMQEFLKHGYAGARIDKIVIAAGVSKATLYRHFADKEALFTALIQRMATSTQLNAFSSFFQRQDFLSLQEEPASLLKRYATDLLNNILQDSQGLEFYRIIIGESGRFPELGRAFAQAVEKPNHDFLTQYFATHPQLQFADPEIAARTFIGTLIHFVIVRELLHGRTVMPIERDRLINGLLDLLID